MKYPEYAAAHNLLEQQGGHDGLRLLLRWLGTNAELRSSPENMIALTPEAGIDFLTFSGIEKNPAADNWLTYRGPYSIWSALDELFRNCVSG